MNGSVRACFKVLLVLGSHKETTNIFGCFWDFTELILMDITDFLFKTTVQTIRNRAVRKGNRPATKFRIGN